MGNMWVSSLFWYYLIKLLHTLNLPGWKHKLWLCSVLLFHWILRIIFNVLVKSIFQLITIRFYQWFGWLHTAIYNRIYKTRASLQACFPYAKRTNIFTGSLIRQALESHEFISRINQVLKWGNCELSCLIKPTSLALAECIRNAPHHLAPEKSRILSW